MKGQKFLKITGILMIIAAVISILAGVVVGGFGALAAGLGAASGLTGSYWVALLLTLGGGIIQLIAGIKVVALFSLAGVAMNMVNGGEFSVTNILTGVAVPVLYIYGAVLNSKSNGTYTA